MSNRRYPTGPPIDRMGPLRTNEVIITRTRDKAYRRSWWVLDLRCAWDARLDRDLGCHVHRRAYYASCPTHPHPETPRRTGRAA